MTGPRKRTPEQESILAQIAHAAAQERTVYANAQAEAKALIAARVHEAQNKTNALMYQAHYEYGITKTAITAEGLGTTNRQAADPRLREYMAEAGLTPAETLAERAQMARTPAAGIRVEVGGDVVSVILDGFTHPDVGDNLVGTVQFTPDGEMVALIEPNDALTTESDNPLWSMRLWDIDQIQEATR